MKITTVLFDLDGTLLPMDQDLFIKAYFSGIADHMSAFGYEGKQLAKTIWASTGAMIYNTTGKTNEEAFWAHMASAYGPDIRKESPRFDEFYRVGFPKVRQVCGFTPMAARIVDACKEKGFQIALATNPFFPATATWQRTQWAGLNPHDFALITTYENSGFCKPNPSYFREVMEKLGVCPEECLMVGNDVEEDMMAQELGMQVFLLTPCMINKKEKDITQYPHGDYEDLLQLIEKL